MLKAHKYRIYPNLKQKEYLEYLAKTFGCTRFIDNKMLNDKIEDYKQTGEMLKNTLAQYKVFKSKKINYHSLLIIIKK